MLYFYRKGVNPLAVAAFIPLAVISLSMALIPTFGPMAPSGWFIGAAISAVLYFAIARGWVQVAPRHAIRTSA